MADLLDTPSRVLKRVQQYEDEEEELPSLPSFQIDSLDLSDDYDVENQDSVTNADEASQAPEREHYSTPHVARALRSPRTASSARTESTVKPLRSSTTSVPTPAPAFRSTNCLPNSELDISYDSCIGNLAASDASTGGADAQHAYEDYSSISERLPPPSAGSGYYDRTEEYQPSVMMTPMAHMAHPPGRSTLPFLAAENTPKPANDARIPSLSRSEVSSTDNEATTPEGREPLQLPVTSLDHFDSSKLEATYELTTENLVSARSPSPVILNSPEATPVAIRYMDHPSTAARAAATPFGVAPLRDVTTRYINRRPPSPSIDYPDSSRAPVDHTIQRKGYPLSVLASNSLPSRPSPLRSALAPRSSPGSISTTARSDDAASMPCEDGASNISARSLASQEDHLGDSSIRYRDGHLAASEIRHPHPNTSTRSSHQIDSVSPFAKIQRHLNKMDQQLLDTSSDLDQEHEDWRGERRRLLKIIRDAGLDIDSRGLVGELDTDAVTTHDSFSEVASLRAQLHDSRAQLQDVLDEMSKLKSDFTRKTEEHYHVFTEIGADYTKQIESLQDELGRAKGEVTRLQTQLGMLRPSSAVQEDELRKQIAILGGDLSRAQEDAQVVAEALANAQARLSEAHANEQATLEQLQEAEDQAKMLQSQLDSAEREAQLCTRRAEDFQSRLTAAEEKTHALQSQLDAARREDTFATSSTEDLQKRLSIAERLAEDRARQTSTLETRLMTAEDRVDDHVRLSTTLEARLASLEEANDTLEAEKEAMSQQISGLERHQRDDQDVISDQSKVVRELEEGIAVSNAEIKANKNRIDELEEFLFAAHAAQASSQAELESLKNQLEIARPQTAEFNETRDTTIASSPNLAAVYEEQLDEAYRHIGRLKAEFEGIPARHKTLEDRDARIRALETEKETLLERLKAREMATPSRWANSMRTSTPVVHKAVSALRSPRTPGSLKDLSWLQTTMDDSNESLLRTQLEQLQLELDAANTQLDKNFDRLEAAGLGAVRLAELLAVANGEIEELKEERIMQARMNKRSEESLEKGRNKKEQLEAALDEVHQRLSSLRDNMTAEKERLQEDNRRLRLQLSDMRLKYDDELERLSEEAARVHEKAQDDISQTTQRYEAIFREKEALSTQLRNSEALVAQRDREVSKLHSSIEEMNETLDNVRHQLASAANAQDKVRSLQATLEEAESLLQCSHENSSRLRNELRLRSDEVADKGHEIEVLTTERQRITRELAQFSEDLAVQRRECAAFGSELQLVRTEQAATRGAHADQLARLEETLRANQADLARATQQAQDARCQCSVLQEQLERADSQAQTTAEQRQRFKAQMRRLSAQIEYLKAVYTRENMFRNALALQKKFLILCVGGMSLKRMAEQWQATRQKRNAGIKRDQLAVGA